VAAVRVRGIHDTAHRQSGRTSRPVSGLAGEDVTSSGTTPSHALGTVADVAPPIPIWIAPAYRCGGSSGIGAWAPHRIPVSTPSRLAGGHLRSGDGSRVRPVAAGARQALGVSRLAGFVRAHGPVGAHPVRDSRAGETAP